MLKNDSLQAYIIDTVWSDQIRSDQIRYCEIKELTPQENQI